MTCVTAACSPLDNDNRRTASKPSHDTAWEPEELDGSKPTLLDPPPIRRRGTVGSAGVAADGDRQRDAGVKVAAGGGGQGPSQSGAGAEDMTSSVPATEPEPSMQDQAGWAALIDWPGLPTFTDAAPQLFSTHERGEAQMFALVDPGNKDFNSFLAICGDQPVLLDQQNDAAVSCQPGETGYLIAAADGPGYVSRILLSRGVSDPSSSVLVNVKPTGERIRIYLDGAATPVFDGTWLEWADASKQPFDAPLTGWTSGAVASYLPISYSKQLRVFVDELATSPALHYIQVDTRHVKETKSFAASALTSDDAHVALAGLLERAQGEGASWFDQQVALDGTTALTAWTRARPGTLQRLEITLERASAADVMKETSLRLSWDGDAPAIDLPLEALFGARQTLAPLTTLPMVVQLSDSEVHLILSLPMAFAHSAKLELVHASPDMRTLGLRLLGTDVLPRGEWGKLHATLVAKSAPMTGERFSIAALSGRGKYLGTLLYVKGKADNSRNIAASELGFLEGDERLEIDGKVAGLGTGTDNYFNGGFYFQSGVYNSPFAAVSQLLVSSADRTSEATLLRWNVLSDALDFQRQFQLSFEFGADRPATVREYAAVSFYYQ